MMFLLIISGVFAYCASYSKATEFHSSAFVFLYHEESVGSESQHATFKCPHPFGYFSDPEDCSKFYACFMNMAMHRSCRESQKFDTLRKQIFDGIDAVCGNNKDTSTAATASPTKTTSGVSTTVDKLTSFSPSTTYDKTSITPSTIVDGISVSTVVITETSVTTNSPTTTEEDRKPPTGPPETNCPEGDDECLINETGDPNDWFKCPAAFGSHPHPSSIRLFIFCKNWLPSVKKCGMNKAYSKEKATCV